MEYMKTFPDKYFELAIVDPPYGIKAGKMQLGTGKERLYKRGKDWDDDKPNDNFFNELFRVSENQIIWGANYFSQYLPFSRGWIFWDKMTDGFAESYASGEMAFTSFDRNVKQFTYKQQGNYVGFPNQITTVSSNPHLKKIHPTQKPVVLYEWLLNTYAKQGDKILDTHMGSQSSRIAAHDMGFDYYGSELDKDYFEAGCKRYENHIKQLTIF